MNQSSASYSSNLLNKLKVAFIHGRPAPHPIHTAFANSLKASFIFVDHKMRWHDISSSPIRRYMSFFLSAIFFPDRKRYHFFLSEGFHFMPMLLRFLGLLRNDQKVIYLMGDEGLFYLYTKFYSRITCLFTKFFLKNCDALICVGNFQTSLAKAILKDKCPPIYQVFNGINDNRLKKLTQLSPDLQGHKIILIANGPSGWRIHYKGLDLIVESVKLAKQELPDLELIVVGDWSQDVIRTFTQKDTSIKFVGKAMNIEYYLQKSALCLHTARGEAWGISITEAMAAGVPPIISEWTGCKEVVEKVDERLIIKLDQEIIRDKIMWYFNLSLEEKKKLSQKCREAAKPYSEASAVKIFREKFNQLIQEV